MIFFAVFLDRKFHAENLSLAESRRGWFVRFGGWRGTGSRPISTLLPSHLGILSQVTIHLLPPDRTFLSMKNSSTKLNVFYALVDFNWKKKDHIYRLSNVIRRSVKFTLDVIHSTPKFKDFRTVFKDKAAKQMKTGREKVSKI